jgi:hypothetical protein
MLLTRSGHSSTEKTAPGCHSFSILAMFGTLPWRAWAKVWRVSAMPGPTRVSSPPSIPTNRECLRCLSGVHSTNSNCPTSTGFHQRQFFIFAAVSPSPHRPARASGRFANGPSGVSRPGSAVATVRAVLVGTRSSSARI